MPKYRILEEREISFHEGLCMWVGRIRALGLTAYGRTQDEALIRIEHMLEFAIQHMQSHDRLETWLTRHAVAWRYDDEEEL